MEAQRLLADYLKFTCGKPKVELFFRAEDSFGFTLKIKGLLEDLFGMEEEFEEDIKGSYGLDLAKMVVRGKAKLLEKNSGKIQTDVHIENPSSIFQRTCLSPGPLSIE